MSKTILYIGPFAAGVGIDNGQWFMPGEPVEVDEDLAGRSPTGTPGEEDYDAGAGLLAQTGNFVEADLSAATVADVLAGVDGDPERAAQALAAEQAKGAGARRSLIKQLEAIAAAGGEDGTNG